MSKRLLKLLIMGLALCSFLGILFLITKPKPAIETKFVQSIKEQSAENIEQGEEATDQIQIKKPGDYALLGNPKHTYQTFNNCGPATLSMILSWYGVDVSQKELGEAMRPYQNPGGDNDDKTIFVLEFAQSAEKYGLAAKTRVNGDINNIKRFTANGIPVVVKTWLKVDEDIGHFRIVRGFDETHGVIIQDDSYQGPNKKISYFDFLSMWQPFNYGYVIVYPPEKEDLVVSILGEEKEEKVAYENAVKRAQEESQLVPDNVYPLYNLSTSYFYLGEYQKSADAYEEVESRLPRRMLWYQIEPILAYQKLGNYERVFQITDKILGSGNRAFSELYLIRGEIYLDQGQKDLAKREFELAREYNKNFEAAYEALKNL